MDGELTGLPDGFAAEVTETQQQQAVSEVPEDFGGRLLYGLKMSAVGMSVVFLVLIILMLIIKLFELFTYTLPNKRKKAAALKKTAAEKTESKSDAEDPEIAAVIAAAVDAYYNNAPAQAKKQYRVKSFKRI